MDAAAPAHHRSRRADAPRPPCADARHIMPDMRRIGTMAGLCHLWRLWHDADQIARLGILGLNHLCGLQRLARRGHLSKGLLLPAVRHGRAGRLGIAMILLPNMHVFRMSGASGGCNCICPTERIDQNIVVDGEIRQGNPVLMMVYQASCPVHGEIAAFEDGAQSEEKGQNQ